MDKRKQLLLKTHKNKTQHIKELKQLISYVNKSKFLKQSFWKEIKSVLYENKTYLRNLEKEMSFLHKN